MMMHEQLNLLALKYGRKIANDKSQWWKYNLPGGNVENHSKTTVRTTSPHLEFKLDTSKMLFRHMTTADLPSGLLYHARKRQICVKTATNTCANTFTSSPWFTAARSVSNSLTTSWWPAADASSSGVSPSWPSKSTWAPCFSKSCTVGTWPYALAHISAVRPLLSFTSTSYSVQRKKQEGIKKCDTCTTSHIAIRPLLYLISVSCSVWSRKMILH